MAMSWKKSDSIVSKRFTQRGLGGAIMAGLVCQEANRLYPNLFKAVSLKNGVLHLEISKSEQLNLKLIEGKLLAELNEYAKARNLPVPTRIRLTFLAQSDIL
jgi:hypothetical protein